MILFETYGSVFLGLIIILGLPIGVTVMIIRDYRRRRAARRRAKKARRKRDEAITREMYDPIDRH
ncbi:MAG: hypothetical protein LBN02_03380 [Oscillospiraceae bacterium]|jgi:hypothetical protein|nr:hypothetical protein [Oscillospiraceae bacterium]